MQCVQTLALQHPPCTTTPKVGGVVCDGVGEVAYQHTQRERTGTPDTSQQQGGEKRDVSELLAGNGIETQCDAQHAAGHVVELRYDELDIAFQGPGVESLACLALLYFTSSEAGIARAVGWPRDEAERIGLQRNDVMACVGAR